MIGDAEGLDAEVLREKRHQVFFVQGAGQDKQLEQRAGAHAQLAADTVDLCVGEFARVFEYIQNQIFSSHGCGILAG